MKIITKVYTADELLNLTDRTVEEALCELTNRFDYFFLRTDGSYDLPNYDGHTGQTMKMLGELLLKRKRELQSE